MTESELARVAWLTNIKPEYHNYLDKTFRGADNLSYRVVGLRPRAKKYPILIQRVHDKALLGATPKIFERIKS
jgi:hypothetical protein